MTLTRTRACCRSPETSTPVTVTKPMRGSRAVPVRNSATVWRTTSATRSGRWLRRRISEIARARVHDSRAGRRLDEAIRLAQDVGGVGAVGAHHADRDLGALPQVLMRRLRRGDVKLVVQPRLDRKSTRLNSSHVEISYAVFCLKKKKKPGLVAAQPSPATALEA